jgi:hypothetical protein
MEKYLTKANINLIKQKIKTFFGHFDRDFTQKMDYLEARFNEKLKTH